jgi:hypothetical protein
MALAESIPFPLSIREASMSVRSTSFHSAGGVPDRLHGANRGRWQSGCPTARHQQHVHEPADAYRHQVDLNLGVSKNTEV